MNKLLLTIFISLGLLLKGCAEVAELTGQDKARPTCAKRVIDRAYKQYGEAKTGLALFFEEHNDNRLYQAYYAAWDSKMTANLVKKCWDRRVSHFNAMKNLKDMNNQLAHIIRRNMPDDDPGALIAIYREQYLHVMNPMP